MIWVCPLVLVLGMHAVEKYISPVFFRILCVGFTIMTVRSVLAVGFLAAAKTSLFGTIEVRPNSHYLPGYEAIYDAMPGDTVLYVGGENTAEYPCWGWKYDRTVWAADTTATLEKYFERLPNWVVLEEEAPESLRLATLELLSTQQYRREFHKTRRRKLSVRYTSVEQSGGNKMQKPKPSCGRCEPDHPVAKSNKLGCRVVATGVQRFFASISQVFLVRWNRQHEDKTTRTSQAVG